jgi:hypothetical protein
MKDDGVESREIGRPKAVSSPKGHTDRLVQVGLARKAPVCEKRICREMMQVGRKTVSAMTSALSVAYYPGCKF